MPFLVFFSLSSRRTNVFSFSSLFLSLYLQNISLKIYNILEALVTAYSNPTRKSLDKPITRLNISQQTYLKPIWIQIDGLDPPLPVSLSLSPSITSYLTPNRGARSTERTHKQNLFTNKTQIHRRRLTSYLPFFKVHLGRRHA